MTTPRWCPACRMAITNPAMSNGRCPTCDGALTAMPRDIAASDHPTPSGTWPGRPPGMVKPHAARNRRPPRGDRSPV